MSAPCDVCGAAIPDPPARYPRIPTRRRCGGECRRIAMNERTRAWYAKNRAVLLQRAAAKYQGDPDEYRGRSAAWKLAHPEATRLLGRKIALMNKYGLTLDDYDAMLEEHGGVCGICQRPEMRRSKNGRTLPLGVDHDHTTGEVRGLLCGRCNSILGFIEDRDLLEAALGYLFDRDPERRQEVS